MITFTFIKIFFQTIFYVSPILLFLVFLISLMGLAVGKMEKWTRMDALYFAFITATTVGYGDIRPKESRSKFLSIIIALVGLVLTGIIIAIGVYSVQETFRPS